MIIPFLLDHLINANLYLGYNSTFRHVSMLGYVSRIIGHIDVINLLMTVCNLRNVISFLHKVYFNKGIVWLHVFIENVLGVDFLRYNVFFRMFVKRLLLKSRFRRHKDNGLKLYFFK
jgi:hypothetical protein